MAIEFWCTLCDEEIERAAELEDCQAMQRPPTTVNYKFVEGFYVTLIQLLLAQVVKVEDELDDDNISTSAGTCLTLVANTIRDQVVQVVLPFVNANFQNPDWKLRASAILTFGYILEGPSHEVISPLVAQALPVLMITTRDQNGKV